MRGWRASGHGARPSGGPPPSGRSSALCSPVFGAINGQLGRPDARWREPTLTWMRPCSPIEMDTFWLVMAKPLPILANLPDRYAPPANPSHAVVRVGRAVS